MNKYCLIFLLLLPALGFSQSSNDTFPKVSEAEIDSILMHIPDLADTGKVFQLSPEIKIPEFNGGMDGLVNYLSTHIKYPKKSKKNGTTGKVLVAFVITYEGKVSQAHILRGVDEYIDKEALRVVTQMPDWQPGARSGKPIAVSFVLPINFNLY